MGTTVPDNSKALSNLGMDAISLDFHRRCAAQAPVPLPSAQTETICTGFFLPVSRVPYKAFPSMGYHFARRRLCIR